MDTGISSQAEITKLCSKCGISKPISEFRIKAGRRYFQCGACEKEYAKVRNRKYYERNKETIKAAAAAYYRNNKDAYLEWRRGYTYDKHREFKRAALAVFGEKCACCGEQTFEFLTLDHVDNDGNVHRREIRGRNIYEWLSTTGYKTSFRLQTLCFNCNFAKRYNGGTCPHQMISEGSTTSSRRSVRRKRGGSAGPL